MSTSTATITTYFRVCDGVRVRYADTKAKSDTTLLMHAHRRRVCGRSGASGTR